MPEAPRRPPLDGIDRVIVDGTNLLYRLGASAGGPAPASAVVGRMRGAIPLTASARVRPASHPAAAIAQSIAA